LNITFITDKSPKKGITSDNKRPKVYTNTRVKQKVITPPRRRKQFCP